MVISHKAVFLLLLMIIFMPLFCGQAQQRYGPPPLYVHLVLGPFDAFTRTFGLDDDRTFRCARDVLQSQGFVIDDASPVTLSVIVTSLSPSDKDWYPFRIEVHAGTRPSLMAGESATSQVIGDISGLKHVSASMNDDTKIFAGIRELVATVGPKLRKEMLRIRN